MLNLQSIIEAYRLEEKVIASILFPKNKHQIAALRRLLKDNATELKSKQVQRLAFYLNVTITNLVSNTVVNKIPVLTILDKTWIIKVYQKDNSYEVRSLHKFDYLFNKLIFPQDVTLRHLITQLNTLLK